MRLSIFSIGVSLRKIPIQNLYFTDFIFADINKTYTFVAHYTRYCSMDAFHLAEGYIITYDESGEKKLPDGREIHVIPFYKWVLQPS